MAWASRPWIHERARSCHTMVDHVVGWNRGIRDNGTESVIIKSSKAIHYHVRERLADGKAGSASVARALTSWPLIPSPSPRSTGEKGARIYS